MRYDAHVRDWHCRNLHLRMLRAIRAGALCAVVFTAGCQTRSEAAYEKSKDAYVACVQAKGAASCEGEKAVMDADAHIYATASGLPQAVQTLTVPIVR